MKKQIFIILLLASYLLVNISWAEAKTENKWDIWLVAPLSNENLSCYSKDQTWKENIVEWPCEKEGKWITIQKIEDANTTGYSSIWLLNKYLWLLLDVIIKLWVLISIWFVVVWWIMMSSSWGSEDKNKWWKDMLIWWLASMLVIILWWIILHTINPWFYIW